jgi:hypothetical protein
MVKFKLWKSLKFKSSYVFDSIKYKRAPGSYSKENQKDSLGNEGMQHAEGGKIAWSKNILNPKKRKADLVIGMDTKQRNVKMKAVKKNPVVLLEEMKSASKYYQEKITPSIGSLRCKSRVIGQKSISVKLGIDIFPDFPGDEWFDGSFYKHFPLLSNEENVIYKQLCNEDSHCIKSGVKGIRFFVHKDIIRAKEYKNDALMAYSDLIGKLDWDRAVGVISWGYTAGSFLNQKNIIRDRLNDAMVIRCFNNYIRVLFPVLDNGYWSLFVVDNLLRRIFHLDPIKRKKSKNLMKIAHGLKRLAKYYARPKLPQDYLIDWNYEFNSPIQHVGHNSGPLVCLYMYCMVKALVVPTNFDVVAFRKRIAIDILRGHLSMDPLPQDTIPKSSGKKDVGTSRNEEEKVTKMMHIEPWVMYALRWSQGSTLLYLSNVGIVKKREGIG